MLFVIISLRFRREGLVLWMCLRNYFG